MFFLNSYPLAESLEQKDIFLTTGTSIMRSAGHVTLLSCPRPSKQTGCQEESDSLAESDT